MWGDNYKYQQRKQLAYTTEVKHANTSSDLLVQRNPQSGLSWCKTLGTRNMVKTHAQSDILHLLSKYTNSIYKSGIVRHKALF